MWKHLVFPCDKVCGQFQYLFSTWGLFFGLSTLIERVSFLTPPTDRSWTAVITHSISSSRGRLGGLKEVWNHIGSPGGHRERNLMGQGQAFWVAPPHCLPGRKPLTEECPGAQDPQLWTGSGGSGATLLQDSTPAQVPPLHSD